MQMRDLIRLVEDAGVARVAGKTVNYLVDPTVEELYPFIDDLSDREVRGLVVGQHVYFWPAFLAMHELFAQLGLRVAKPTEGDRLFASIDGDKLVISPKSNPAVLQHLHIQKMLSTGAIAGKPYVR